MHLDPKVTSTFPIPAVNQRLLIVAPMGLPGAGKSLVAHALEEQLGLRRVCRDGIRHAMFPHCNYSYAEKRAAFRAVLLALEINCLLGCSSVIDGMTFSRHRDIERVAKLAERYNALFLPLLMECPPSIARERITRDTQHPAHDRTPDIVSTVLARTDPPPAGVLRIDATLPALEVCRLAIATVNARMNGI